MADCLVDEWFPLTNSKVVLAGRPKGSFAPSCFNFVDEVIPAERCGEDEAVIKVAFLSVDAYIRTMLDEQAYHSSIAIGGNIPALGIGKVISSSDAAFPKGTLVIGPLGAQTYSITKVAMLQPLSITPSVAIHDYLGVLGLTSGLTAYMGIYKVTNPPQVQETVVVSAAAGSVGLYAAQFAKNLGARVIGIAGGAEKTSFLINTLNLDGAVDYKDPARTVSAQLAALAPNGVDFFFDNVGGDILDMVLERINSKGRIVICGAVSQYEGNLNVGRVHGPTNYLKLAERGASMVGFNVMQHFSEIPAAKGQILELIEQGRIRSHYQIEDSEGLRGYPSALQKLFNGGHIGKLLVKVSSL